MSIKEVAVGVVVTVFIGGAAYTVNQSDVIDNFASDTGLTQQEAEDYITGFTDDDLASFDEIGSELIDSGREGLAGIHEIDCVNYEYEWESHTMNCNQAKEQFREVANLEISLGEAFRKLDADSGSIDDIPKTIRLIDQLNAAYDYEIMHALLGRYEIEESQKINSYNKALLTTILENERR